MAENEIKDAVGTTDDLAEDVLLSQRKAWLIEITQHEEQLDDKTKLLARYREQWEVDKEMMELQFQDNGLELLRPVYKFQTTPRYAELAAKQARAKFEWEVAKAEGQVQGMELSLEKIAKQLESLKTSLAENSAALDKMGVKYD